VAAQEYPNILVTAGLNGRCPLDLHLKKNTGRLLSRLVCDNEPDPRVMYSEPAKYVAKLRELKTDGNLLLFKCELGAGHFSKSGRYRSSLFCR